MREYPAVSTGGLQASHDDVASCCVRRVLVSSVSVGQVFVIGALWLPSAYVVRSLAGKCFMVSFSASSRRLETPMSSFFVGYVFCARLETPTSSFFVGYVFCAAVRCK